MCKHGLTEGTCWLCSGHEQEEAGNFKNFGCPPWFINSSQLAMRIQYSFSRRFSKFEEYEGMPKGSQDSRALTSLPYHKYSGTGDTKTRHQYQISISKKSKK